MTQEELQKEILKSNAEVKSALDDLKKRLLSTSDRKFLYDLVTKVANPAQVYATQGNGAVVLAAGVSQTVVEQNEIRFSTTIVNAGANDAFINFQQGAAVVTTGLLLRANGGAVTFGRGTDIPFVGRVTGFSVGGTTLTFTTFSLPEVDLEF